MNLFGCLRRVNQKSKFDFLCQHETSQITGFNGRPCMKNEAVQ